MPCSYRRSALWICERTWISWPKRRCSTAPCNSTARWMTPRNRHETFDLARSFTRRAAPGVHVRARDRALGRRRPCLRGAPVLGSAAFRRAADSVARTRDPGWCIAHDGTGRGPRFFAQRQPRHVARAGFFIVALARARPLPVRTISANGADRRGRAVARLVVRPWAARGGGIRVHRLGLPNHRQHAGRAAQRRPTSFGFVPTVWRELG